MAVIIIHRTLCKDLHGVFREVYDSLYMDYVDVMRMNHRGPMWIDLPDVQIRFICGNDMSKLAGLRPDYWWSDSWRGSKILYERAYSVGGKEIKNLNDLPKIIAEIYSNKERKEINEHFIPKL